MKLPINQIICGDCLEVMKGWPDESIDCCVTSPPYWGLRDYGVEEQLGLEKTPEEYVEKMVWVFREVKRLLKPQGTLWLNLGDSYCGGGRGWKYCNPEGKQLTNKGTIGVYKSDIPKGLKPKDLVGIPWRVAFALQADGWYLRQDIIWHKPNPMPESVTDRCTKSHEYIFLLAKNKKYYYDNEAIKEDSIDAESYTGRRPRSAGQMDETDPDNYKFHGSIGEDGKLRSGQKYLKRNKRSVWAVNTNPYPDAHFAVFPPDLIKPCILAGCPKDGIVLDPFMGSGTTAVVAAQNGRNYVGVELNPEYINLGRVDAVETGVPVKEQRIGQKGLFE